MKFDVTTTYLEMTSPDLLKPANSPPSLVEFEELTISQATRDRLRSVHLRVAAPYRWRRDWVDVNWSKWNPQTHQLYVIRANDDDIGLLILEIHDNDAVEIRMFGLVPEFVGRGFGGAALAEGTRIAWSVVHTRGNQRNPTKRVWLHTASIDHEHALKNYLARGFTIYDVVQEQKELST